MSNGIFCLEGEWFGDYKKPTTIEPALHLLRSISGTPFIHRNVATVEEFAFYVDQWLLKKHFDHPILYLAFHGESGCLCVGDQRRSDGQLGLDWFEKRICDRGTNRVLYFGSCLTLDLHGNRIRSFVQRTGLAGVIGSTTEVDWLESAMVDISMLCELSTAEPLGGQQVLSAYKRSRERMAGLCDKLGLRFVTSA